MMPARDTISPSVCILRLSRVGESISARRDTGQDADDANTPHQSQPLIHLAALLREMHSAALPIARIAQQQAQRLKSRHAA